MRNKMKYLVIFFYIFFFSFQVKADWTTVEFFTKDKENIGNAEGVDSWFLQLPAFKFNLNNLKPGKYRIALYDGSSCEDYGLPIHKNKPELNAWNPENLVNFYVDENGKFNTTLGLKPEITTADNRGLISIGSMRGKPLLIFNKEDNLIFACGLIPIKD